MKNYTIQVVKRRMTYFGKIKHRELFREEYDKFGEAMVRTQQLTAAGHIWILHDWCTDVGPMPEPEESKKDDDDLERRWWAAKIDSEESGIPF